MNKFFWAVGLVATLGACSNTQNHGGLTATRAPVGLESTKHIGVVAAKQTRQIDTTVEGRNETAYFFPIYNEIMDKRPGFEGVSGDSVYLTVRSGPDIYWSETVTLDNNGVSKVSLPAGTKVPTSSALCVETQWPIAHQSVRPAFAVDGQNVACTETGALHRYLRTEGSGDTADDAYGVIVIKAKG